MIPSDGQLPPPGALIAWGATHAGVGAALSDCSHPLSTARVWRLTDPDGEAQAYLKLYPDGGRGYAQECTALRRWAASLIPSTPALLAVDIGGCPALATDPLPGAVVAESDWSPTRETVIFQAAGGWLRAYHDLPFTDADPVPPAEALRRRFGAWRRRATGLVTEATIDAVGARLAAVEAYLPRARVPCHRDYTPRNWLWAEAGEAQGIRVLDFEHSRPDIWLADLVRLWGATFPQRDDLRHAFFAGYGRQPGPDERQALDALAALEGLTTVAWAREHGDPAFEARGRDILDRMFGSGA